MSHEERSLIRNIIGCSRIKYSVLDEIIQNEHINFQQYKHAVLLVDAHCVFKRLYRDRDLQSIYADSQNELIMDLVVGFMNVLGHYRRYFVLHQHIDLDIYVSFNRVAPHYQCDLVPYWKEDQVNRYQNPAHQIMNSAIEKAWEFIISICSYIDGIYAIDAPGVDDSVALGYIIHGMPQNTIGFIFSKSVHMLQILDTSNGIPIYQLINHRDNSVLVSKDDCIKRVVLKDCKRVPHEKIQPAHLPMLWTLAGCADVNIKIRGNISRIVHYTNEMLNANPEIDLYQLGITDYIHMVEKAIISRKGEPVLVRYKPLVHRYKALSVDLGIKALTMADTTKLRMNLYDRYDQVGLEKINDLLSQMSSNPNLLELENLNMGVVDD